MRVCASSQEKLCFDGPDHYSSLWIEGTIAKAVRFAYATVIWRLEWFATFLVNISAENAAESLSCKYVLINETGTFQRHCISPADIFSLEITGLL
jgi:hypothetical protein